MELHELKNTWMVLDEQLKKNEMLNKQIILEMLRKKSSKSLNRLVNTDFIGFIVLLLGIPAAIWLLYDLRFENFLFPKVLFITLIFISLIGLIFYSYKLKYLMKIDLSKDVKDNLYCLNKYNIMLKQEKLSAFIIGPFLAILGVLCYYELKATLSLWVFLVVGITIGGLVTYWMFKRIYDTSIQSIKQSLNELNELKEE